MDIISLQNPTVKRVVKLREDKRARKNEGLMLVEGFDELTLALKSGLAPQFLFSAPELTTRRIEASDVTTVTRTVFEKMSYRENPDGWLGVFPIPKTSLDDLDSKVSRLWNPQRQNPQRQESLESGRKPLIIVAESVEKPGNLGAILRTADAAGADAVLVCDPRVDLWNPNVVRASRGAIFVVPTVETDNASALAWLKSKNVQTLAATPSAETNYSSIDLTQAVAIVVGTEDEGLSEFWLTNADIKVKIPMMGKVNSLNVSTAAAILIYEAARQRGEAKDEV